MASSWIGNVVALASRRKKPIARRRGIRLQVEEMERRITPTGPTTLPQTWVSGVGDDVNPGSRTAPDKTFAGAISKTDAGGIIEALDPAGFGSVTITKSITIDGSGTLASVLASGINGININAGASDVVTLRHLKLQGIGAGLKGINIISAAEVHIEDCVIENFTGVAIDFEPTNAGAKLFVTDTQLIDNAGGGILVAPNGVAAVASIDRVSAQANKYGVKVQDNAQVSISNSVAVGSTENGFQTLTTTIASLVDLVNDIASNNGMNGVTSEGANSFVTYSGLTAVGNSALGTLTSGGSLTAAGANEIADNSRGFTPLTLNQTAGTGSAASRTWVSGVGDDANPASRTAPAKTFPGAISKTAKGGEIDVLDPGSFGAVTIVKSITLDGGAAFAGITASSGGNSITINLGTTNGIVILRGLSLDGQSQLGVSGIKIVAAGAVFIEDSIIKNFSGAGIDFEPTNDGAQLFVANTLLVNNAGGGILVKPNGVLARAAIDGVQAYGNKFGVRAEDGADVLVSNSVASGSTENGFQTVGGTSGATMNLQGDLASNNGTNGVSSEGNTATANFSNLNATGNSGPATASVSSGVLNPIGSNSFTDNGKGYTPIALSVGSGGGTFRTWVSGVGDDVNPGSRTAPNLTFAGAFAHVAAGGEIDALDSGDFSSVTISKSVTIDGGNNLAGITSGATDTITINAGASDVVILRHLTLNGQGIGLHGVKIIQAGAVIIEDCVIENFTGSGVDFEPTNAGAKLFVHNTQLLNNGGGFLSKPGAANTLATLDHVQALANTLGFRAEDQAEVAISNSVASGSNANGFQVVSASLAAQMNLETDGASNNGQNAVLVDGANAHIALSNLMATGNSGQGIVSVHGGSVLSLANNRFADNAKSFTPLALALGSGGGPSARTWVSGVGDDANPASRTAPDLTFTGALADTAAGGEIDTIDQGEFEPVAISRSVTIDGSRKSTSILTATATNAITIDAGPNDVVILRGLTLNGLGGTGLSGIQIIQAGAVIIDDCLIENFSGPAIDFGPSNSGAQVFVTNTLMLNNGGAAFLAKPIGVTARATLDHVQAEGNTFGFRTQDQADVAISDSHVSGTDNNGVEALAASSSSAVSLESVVSAVNQSNGVFAQGPVAGSSTVSATIYVSNVAAVGNTGHGLLANSASPADSFVVSFGNIQTTDNGGGNGTPTSVLSQTATLPSIGSPSVAGITLGATVTGAGGSPVIARGVVISLTSTNANPQIGGTGVTNLTAAGTTGAFTVNAIGLTAGLNYSFTAYAINGVGTSYSSPTSTFVAPTNTAQFSAASESVSHNQGTFSITVTLAFASTTATSIPFTLGGTAVSGTDYNGVTTSPLVIPANQTSGVITGTIIDNGLYGSTVDKTLTVTLGMPTGANLGSPSTNTLTISAVSTRPSFPGETPQQRYVQALYLAELGRAGSTAELDGWVTVLNGPGGAKAVAAGIKNSAEGRDHLAKSWYDLYLGRHASGGEEMGWANLLMQGQSEEAVLSQILGSAEFYARAQTLVSTGSPDQRYVQALYNQLLHRNGATGDIAAWIGLLPQLGRQGVAKFFLQSVEYRTIMITSFYTNLLHRPPDSAGLTGWVKSGLDISAVRAAFEGSAEFMSNG